MPENIVDANELNFEFEVLNYSFNVPVVVEFWADWSKPCKQLAPILERLTLEANGSYRLARVNVDDNPTLAMRFNVYSIPNVKAISQGQVVSEFSELQPEHRVRGFLQKITPPSPLTLAVRKANSLLSDQNWEDAEIILEEILEKNPVQAAALFGLIKTSLGLGNPEQALQTINTFPTSKEFAGAQTMKPLAETLSARKNGLITIENDLDAVYNNSLKLAERGNIPAALDGLLEILKQDKHYQKDKAHKVVLGMFELLGDDNPQTRQYRSELASILF